MIMNFNKNKVQKYEVHNYELCNYEFHEIKIWQLQSLNLNYKLCDFDNLKNIKIHKVGAYKSLN